MVRTGIDIYAAHIGLFAEPEVDLLLTRKKILDFMPRSLHHYFPSHLSPENERERKKENER